ncbi:MAG: Lrp/AsnC family transcriptional regulator [Pseudomonadota bacterium]
MKENVQGLAEADRDILRHLQRDATLSLRDVADRVGMSQSTVWRRIEGLEAAGFITGRVTLVDPERAGLSVCVFVQVNLRDHQAETRRAFETLIHALPEAMDCYAVTGAFDYTVILRTASVAAFEDILMQRILGAECVANASSHLSLRQIKHSTALPL